MTERAAPERRTWADSWKAPALLAAAAFAAFLPALWNGFTYDDMRFIVENPNVQRPESWLRLVTDAGTADPAAPWGIVRPLRTVEFAADRALFGPGPLAFHVHSMLWHVAAAVLLLLVLRRLLGDPRAAFFAALVWAVHPSHVESVAWITSRGDVAMGACSLASIHFALRSKGYDRDLAASLVAAALAMLYKETGLALPLVIGALMATRFVRVSAWPHFPLAVLYLVYHLAVRVGANGLNVAFVLGGSFGGTLATMTRAFGWYLCQTLLPAFSQDWYLSPSTSFADGAALFWLAVNVALIAWAVARFRKEPRWTLAVAVFYLFFAPVSNVAVSVSIPTTERFMYVPLAGAAIGLGLALRAAPRRLVAATTLVALAFGATSAHRSTYWRDDKTLWTTVIADHESARGRESVAERTETEALELRDAAAAMPPGAARDETEAKSNRLMEEALDHAHRSIDATYAFEMVERSTSVAAMRAEYNASNMCYWLGRHAEALFHAEEALAIYDKAAEPFYDRALALSGLNFAPQAIESMRRARALSPKRPDPGVAGFFFRMSDECEKRALYLAARDGFAAALEAAPPGQIADVARRRLDAAFARPRSEDEDAAERAAVSKLEADLAALPRTCPVRRDHVLRR